MGEEKNLISLKEAAEISGYSADYIGQLIRAGKIPGKQVYTNITWMTTAEAVLAHKSKGKNNKKESIADKAIKRKRLFGMQINILKLIMQNFKAAMPLVIIVFVSLILLISYLFYLTLSDNGSKLDGWPGDKAEREVLTFWVSTILQIHEFTNL